MYFGSRLIVTGEEGTQVDFLLLFSDLFELKERVHALLVEFLRPVLLVFGLIRRLRTDSIQEEHIVNLWINPLVPRTELLQPVRIVHVRHLAHVQEVFEVAHLHESLLAHHFYLLQKVSAHEQSLK